MNVLRHNQLKDLFAGSTAGLVFVTTFLDRATMREYLPEIAWETLIQNRLPGFCVGSPVHHTGNTTPTSKPSGRQPRRALSTAFVRNAAQAGRYCDGVCFVARIACNEGARAW